MAPQKSQEKKSVKMKQVPKSYLLAMESLQQVVENKNTEIENLKAEIMEKENDLLNC